MGLRCPLWFCCPWNGLWSQVGITEKELLPIVLAVAVWGRFWAHQRVRILCDNQAVVHICSSWRCRTPLATHLLRCLHLFAAHWDVTIKVEHISGAINHIPDALSRKSYAGVPSQGTGSCFSSNHHPVETVGLAGNIPARLDVMRLEEQAQFLVSQGIAPSTARVYDSGKATYPALCTRLGMPPIPASEDLLLLFVVELAQTVVYSTIRTYLAGLRHLHVWRGGW